MDMRTVTESRWFMKALIATGLVLAALLVFQAGVYVGVHKAALSYRMGESYYRALGPAPFPQGIFSEELSEANGAAGQILGVSLPTFVVQDPHEGEKTIVVGSTTAIRFMRDATSSSAITPGRSVIVIGTPNENGQIEASFIRLLPPPPTGR